MTEANTTKEEVQEQALSVINEAQQVSIVDAASLEAAATVLRRVKGARLRVNEIWKPMIQAQNVALKTIRAEFTKLDTPLMHREREVKNAIGQYTEAENRKRQEAQAKAREEARLLAEAQRLEQAETLEKEGRVEEADAALERPAFVPAPPIQEEVKPEGISTRKNWKAEVIDLMTLVKAVAEGKVSLAFLKADSVSLGRQARATKEDTVIPGVRVFAETVVSARSE